MQQDKLAVLIDADNASPATAQALFEEIAKYGTASVKRIYGDWSSPNLNGWRAILLKHAITPVQQFAYTKGKDATDMSLIIDAMDLLYSGNFNGFCLVSSDSDFTPLASRIRAAGLVVYGFGKQSTPEAFRQACDRFLYVENLRAADTSSPDTAPDAASDAAPGTVADAAPAAAAPAPRPAVPRHMDAGTRSLLYKAIKDATDEETGWALVGKIANVISETRPDFDPRSYGYGKLSGMLRDLRGLQLRSDEASRLVCRKIPFGSLIKLLQEGMGQFKNAKGWASQEAMAQYIKPRWNWQDYGFDSFAELLAKTDPVEVLGDAMRLKDGSA